MIPFSPPMGYRCFFYIRLSGWFAELDCHQQNDSINRHNLGCNVLGQVLVLSVPNACSGVPWCKAFATAYLCMVKKTPRPSNSHLLTLGCEVPFLMILKFINSKSPTVRRFGPIRNDQVLRETRYTQI